MKMNMMQHLSSFLLLLLSARTVDGYYSPPTVARRRRWSAAAISHYPPYRINRYNANNNNLLSSSQTKTTELFSSAAAIPVADSEDGGTNINYGPAFKVGKLKVNLFALLFGLYEVTWGILFWYPVMTLYALLRKISSKLPFHPLRRIDPFRRIPICAGFVWAMLSFTPFGMWPKVEGRENLDVIREVEEDGKRGKIKPAMYVANHSSWMDIPFVAWVLGLANYKMIAKAELAKAPIVGRAVQVGGHVMLDRTNRRSQMAAFKTGVQWLKDGVNLVTFAEGTRSKTGRMGSFKKGAFKMAQTAGAPIVPMSIRYADKVQPVDYLFPAKSSRSHPKAVIRIGKPIMTEGKTDDALLEEVWRAIADGLPDEQKPTEDTPMGA
mmetsp:Transcript_40027/g.96303  ORF Transcript_40027/g.96303 Transcript_40027/m.96303 type:complete len:380 (-) Transcript_40027:285-1424(-)